VEGWRDAISLHPRRQRQYSLREGSMGHPGLPAGSDCRRARRGITTGSAAGGREAQSSAQKPAAEQEQAAADSGKGAKKAARRGFRRRRAEAQAARMLGQDASAEAVAMLQADEADREAGRGGSGVVGLGSRRHRGSRQGSSSARKETEEEGATVSLPDHARIEALVRQREEGAAPRMVLGKGEGAKIGAHLRAFTRSARMRNKALLLYVNTQVLLALPLTRVSLTPRSAAR
jgi:hypothetical protein